MKKLNSCAKSRNWSSLNTISVCGSIPIEIPILWPRAVMVGPRPRVLLTPPPFALLLGSLCYKCELLAAMDQHVTRYRPKWQLRSATHAQQSGTGMARLTKTCPGSCDVTLPAWEPTPRAGVCCIDVNTHRTDVTRANLHFTLWICIADDSSKAKGVKADFIQNKHPKWPVNKIWPGSTFDESERMIHS
jgi:hypothetical protein